MTPATAPQPGQLVRVAIAWVVADVRRGALPTDPLSGAGNGEQHLVTLASIDDDGAGDETRVVWELEPGARIVEQGALPLFDPHALDDPRRLDAFLDAVRWGARHLPPTRPACCRCWQSTAERSSAGCKAPTDKSNRTS